jgi:hypothetical protein
MLSCPQRDDAGAQPGFRPDKDTNRLSEPLLIPPASGPRQARVSDPIRAFFELSLNAWFAELITNSATIRPNGAA